MTEPIPMPFVVACLAMVLFCVAVSAQAQTDYHGEILKRRPHDWDGAMEKFSRNQGYDVPTYVAEGHTQDEYYGRKIRVGIRKPPVAMLENTYLSFDYYVEGSDFLMVFLFNLDINDNCRYPIPHPTTGKWTTHSMKVTRGGPLGKGHKVDDIFFFAGPPGSRATRLMVDNVGLEGSEE